MQGRSGGASRLVAVFAVVLVGATTMTIAPAVAAEPDPVARDVLVFDVVGERASVPLVEHRRYDSTGAQAPVAGPSVAVAGGVRLARPASALTGPGVELLPPDSGRLEIGSYSGIAGQYSSGPRPVPVLRLVTAGGACLNFAASSPDNRLDVHDVAYDGGTVTRLSATWQMSCGSSGAVAMGELRFRSTDPYTAAGSTSRGLTVVPGSRTLFSAQITNTGTIPLTLGSAQPVPIAGSDARLEVLGETCSQAPLAAGASCTLDLEYFLGGNGTAASAAEVRLQAPSLPRGFVAVFAWPSEILKPPGKPQNVRSASAYDGIALSWTSDSSAPSPAEWQIRRVDGESPVTVATLPRFDERWNDNRWIDVSLAKGETATYQVVARNDAGEAASDPVTVARLDLADPPAAVERSTIVVDSAADIGVADTAAGAAVTVSSRIWQETSVSGPFVRLVLPPFPGPGTFPVGSGPGKYPVSASGPGAYCSSLTGTAEVREAWFRADGTIHRLDADLHLLCVGTIKIEAAVRVGTGTPFVALTGQGTDLHNMTGVVGETGSTGTFRLTNAGTDPVEIGSATLTGTDATGFDVTGTDCPQVLQTGAGCDVSVAFVPTHVRTSKGTLSVATGTAVGTRSVALTGEASGPPPGSTPTAQAVLGRVLVQWYVDPDGGSPLTGIQVRRASGDGEFTPVADLPPTTYQWIDSDVVPGATYRYQLVRTNAYGSGVTPSGQEPSVTVPREELVAAVMRSSAGAELMSLPLGDGSPVPWGGSGDADLPAVSPDGRWAAYVEYDDDGDAGLWLRSLTDGSAPRMLVDAPDADEMDPAWAPNGSKVCFTRFTATAVGIWCVGSAPGATAAAFPGAAGAMEPSWLPNGSGIVATDLTGSEPRVVRITTAGARSVVTGTDGGSWPMVSPRGDRIAFVKPGSTTDELRTVPVAGGASTLLTSTPDLFDRPAWAPDGGALAMPTFGRWGATNVTVWTAAVGSTPASVAQYRAAAGYNVFAVSWRRQDLFAPTVTFPGAPTRTGPSARIPLAIVDDTVPVGGLTVTCSVDGKAAAPCADAWTGTLANGTHTLAVTATDPHQRTAKASYTWTVDAVAPTVSTTALPTFVLTSPVTFSYGATDASGVASYDVRYRRAAWNGTGFGAMTTPSGWSATTSRSRSLAVSPGYEYCFSVRARDAVGNVSAWSAERCTAMPLDDRSLTRATSGWTQTTASSAFAGTLTRTTTLGAKLTRTGAVTRRIVVVATTCSTCGSVEVYLGSTRLTTLSLVSSTTKAKQVLSVPLLSGVKSGTITLRAATSGKAVVIDGLGLRKT